MKSKNELIENIHYYIENGRMVFTERYHLDRGYCCGNKCRHCPYGNKKITTDSLSDKNETYRTI